MASCKRMRYVLWRGGLKWGQEGSADSYCIDMLLLLAGLNLRRRCVPNPQEKRRWRTTIFVLYDGKERNPGSARQEEVILQNYLLTKRREEECQIQSVFLRDLLRIDTIEISFSKLTRSPIAFASILLSVEVSKFHQKEAEDSLQTWSECLICATSSCFIPMFSPLWRLCKIRAEITVPDIWFQEPPPPHHLRIRFPVKHKFQWHFAGEHVEWNIYRLTHSFIGSFVYLWSRTRGGGNSSTRIHWCIPDRIRNMNLNALLILN